MKTKSNFLIVAAALLSFAAPAQELSGYFTGDIASAPPVITEAGITSVTVNFTYDTSVPLAGGPSYFTYNGALKSVTYEFFDAQGQPVAFDIPTPYVFPPDASPLNLAGSFDYEDNYSFNTIHYNSNNVNYIAYFNLSDNLVSPLFVQPMGDYPMFQTVTNQPNALFSSLIISGPATGNAWATINLNVHTLSYEPIDDDGDGVLNEFDLCSTSLTDETVWFDGWYDSGVTNVVDADGCTVMDHYAACAVEEESNTTIRRFRSFFTGPSYCEKQVAYGLVADGTIDYATARQLRDALYYSAQHSGRR